MESVAALTAGIAHNLNNTLAAVMMALDLVGPGLAESQRWIAGALEDSVRRGIDAVRQMLWIAAVRDGEALTYQPLHLLRDVHKLLREGLPPAIEVVTDHPPEVCLVHGDPSLLHQILLALCLEAYSRLPLGGTLTLRASNSAVAESDAVQWPGAHPGDHLRVEVESRGARPLRAPASAPAVPELPATLRAALAREGGFFAARQLDAQTSSLNVYLPAAGAETGPPVPPETTPAAVEPRPGEGRAVLVVEPDPLLRRALAAVLDRHGYRVLAAEDGAQGLAELLRGEEPVAAVLFAAQSVLRDGAGVLRAIGLLRTGTRILLTGDPAALAAVAAPGEGTATLASPFTAAEMLRALAGREA
jgi:CheY-like chemotaxis protein